MAYWAKTQSYIGSNPTLVLTEAMNIIYNMEFIIVNVIYKGILKLVLLFQILQLIAQRPIASIYEKPKKYLLIKVHEE